MRSIRFCAVLALALLAASCTADPAPKAPPRATVSGQIRIDDRNLDLTISSPAMGRDAKVRVLVPPGWSATAARTWPVLYLLQGCCDSHLSWLRQSDVEEFTARADALIVIPDGGYGGWYSDWRVGPGWETFHTAELPAILSAQFRAGDKRAVAGLSMGGLGAMAYAARHPGRYAAAASYSGVLHTTMPHTRDGSPPETDRLMAAFAAGGDATAVWGDPVTSADVWAAHNPHDLVERLRGVRLFVSGGSGAPGPLDPPGTEFSDIEEITYAESKAFAARAEAAGVPVTTDFYGPGTHTWPYWQRALHRSLPMLLSAIGA